MDYQAVSVAAQKHLAALAEDSSLSSCLPQNMNISAPDPKDLRSFIDRLAEKSNNKFGDAQVSIFDFVRSNANIHRSIAKY